MALKEFEEDINTFKEDPKAFKEDPLVLLDPLAFKGVLDMMIMCSTSFPTAFDDIEAKLLETDFLIVIEIALLQQFINITIVVRKLLLIGLQNNRQLISIDLAIMVDIEVIKGKPK